MIYKLNENQPLSKQNQQEDWDMCGSPVATNDEEAVRVSEIESENVEKCRQIAIH